MNHYEMTASQVSAASLAMHNTTPSEVASIIFMVISLVAFCLSLAIIFTAYSGYQSGRVKIHDLYSGIACALIILVCVGALI